MAFRHVPSPAGPVTALADPGTVWRVGYLPFPWNWTPWQYAEKGRFNGRWDDPAGRYRTLYAGLTLLGCLLEVLASFRPDPGLDDDLTDIDEDPGDAAAHPTARPGSLPMSWLEPRSATSATLSGMFCSVTGSDTLSALRPLFLPRALRYGLPDFDAAALRMARPRALTQAVSAWLYDAHTPAGAVFDGVHFHSRHGDEQTLLAVFERGSDGASSSRLSGPEEVDLHPQHPDLARAMALHHLTWAPDR